MADLAATIAAPTTAPSTQQQDLLFQEPYKTTPDLPPEQAIIFPEDGKAGVIPTSEAALARAQKYDFGLGANSPGKDVLMHSIMTGADQELRYNQAREEASRVAVARQKIVNEYLLRSGGKVDENMVKNIREMTREDMTTPEKTAAFFEKKYAEKLATSTMAHYYSNEGASAAVRSFLQDNPDKTHAALDFVSHTVAIKEGVQKKYEDLKTQYESSGWTTKVLANAERFVGPLFDARLKSQFFSLRGNDEEKQRNEIFMMDTDKAISEINKRADEIFAKNPAAALEWLEGMAHYSSSDKWSNNVFDILGFADTLGYAKGAKMALSATNKAAGSMFRDVIKAAGKKSVSPSEMLEATGDFKAAAMANIVSRVGEPVEDINGLMKQIPTIANPQSLMDGSKALSSIQQEHILSQVNRGVKGVLDLLTDRIRTQRVDGDSLAMDRAITENELSFRRENPKLGRNIIDITPANLDASLAGVKYVDYTLGRAVPVEKQVENASEVVAGASNAKSMRFNLDAANNNAPKGKSETLSSASGDVPGKTPTERSLSAGNDNITYKIVDYRALPFETKEAAERAAREDFGLTQFSVIEQNGGHVVQVSRAVDYTLPSVRNALAKDVAGSTESGFIRQWANMLLSKDSKLSESILGAFKVGSYGTTSMMDLVKTIAQPIEDLKYSMRRGSKESYKNFITFNERQRVARNEDGSFGKFSGNQGDFESDWFKEFGKLPNERESAAYWAYVNMNNIEWMVNNLGIYRDKSLAGLRNYVFDLNSTTKGSPQNAARPSIDGPFKQVELTATNDSKQVRLEGKQVTALPWDSKEAFNVGFWDRNGQHYTRNKWDFTKVDGAQGLRDALNEGIASGRFKVVQLSPEGSNAYMATIKKGEKVDHDRVHFLIVEQDLTSEALSLKQIPYRPGGHHMYNYDYYVRQPMLKTSSSEFANRTYYEGDLNAFGAKTEKEAKLFTERMNTARLMLKNNDAGLYAYIQKNLPMTETDFKRMFKDHGGDYDINTPFYHTPSNNSVGEVHKLADVYKSENASHEFITSSESEFNLYKSVNLRYASERGDPLLAIERDHSKANPTFQIRRGEMIDPVTALDRSARQVMNSVYLDEVKAKSIEHFIAEFSSILDKDIGALRRNPLDALVNPTFKADADPILVAAAKDFRRSTMELLNIRPAYEQKVDAFRQRVKEGILESKVGQAVLEKYPHVQDWQLPALEDATHYAKSMAFHLKMGLFNVPTFFQQAMIVPRMAAIVGAETSLKGGAMAINAGLLAMTEKPHIIAEFASKQAKISGVPAERFTEALWGMREAGYDRMGKTHADMSNSRQYGVITSPIGKFADMGTVPVKLGEGVGRYFSWMSAYSEWYKANPNGKFDSAAKQSVLQRADFLNLNMSNVSNADWQNVPGLNIITQFWSVHTRAAEQWLGGKLTPQEMARVFLVDAAMFGVPTTMGATLAAGLWPVGDAIKESKMGQAVNPENNIVTDVLANGFGTVLSGWATGMRMDVGQKFGIGGITMFRDVWNGKKEMSDFLGGVAGKAIFDTIKTTQPLLASVAALASGDSSWYKVAMGDLMDLGRNITTLSNAEKFFIAMNRAEYLTKQGERLTDATTLQGFIIAMTGMQPMAVTEMYASLNEKKMIDKVQTEARKEIQKNFRLAMDALDKQDLDLHYNYMKRVNVAFIDGRFREDERSKIMFDAINESLTKVQKVEEQLSRRFGGADGDRRRQEYINKMEGKN